MRYLIILVFALLFANITFSCSKNDDSEYDEKIENSTDSATDSTDVSGDSVGVPEDSITDDSIVIPNDSVIEDSIAIPDVNEDSIMSNNITISVGGQTFKATLYDNETAEAFKALLPMTITMNELNGNEKYYYLSQSLPTDATRPGTIKNGDLMLYGSSCIVLFYETFSSSYRYTRIGKIDNPSGLADAVGTGNVVITFE